LPSYQGLLPLQTDVNSYPLKPCGYTETEQSLENCYG
jgi:hypothetical protein